MCYRFQRSCCYLHAISWSPWRPPCARCSWCLCQRCKISSIWSQKIITTDYLRRCVCLWVYIDLSKKNSTAWHCLYLDPSVFVYDVMFVFAFPFPKAHVLVCRALSNMLLLPWPSLPEAEQQWPSRSANHARLISSLTQQYRLLPRPPDHHHTSKSNRWSWLRVFIHNNVLLWPVAT